MMELTKIMEQELGLTDQKRTLINEYARKVSKDTLEEVCPALLNVLLATEKGPLKNALGQVIFHLQKNERLNTIIGLQKLIEGALIVNKEKMFEILETSDADAKDLAQNIKTILQG